MQTRRANYKSDDDILIDCIYEESVSITENLFKQNTQNSFRVQKEQMLNLKMRIVEIENY